MSMTVKFQSSRTLKTATAIGVVAALAAGALPATAQDDVRAQILQIPGVGMGSPTDADWQAVGELTLGPTKENIAEGECSGVELTFMGLNNQNLHNFLFRGFLKPWEDYTGATINWIDLAQDDYNGAAAAGHRHRHGGLGHHGDGRAVRGRHGRPRPARSRCPTGSPRRSRWTTTSIT